MEKVDYVQFEGLSLPSTAVAGYQKGYFSKAQWAIYKQLAARYNSTREIFFPCSDSYFNNLNLSRKTIQRVLKDFKEQEMILVNHLKLGESKYPVRYIALRYNFFYVNGFGTLEDVIKGKDRVIRQEREISRRKDEVIEKQAAIISYISSRVEKLIDKQRATATGMEDVLICLDEVKVCNKEITFLDQALKKINTI